MSSAPMPPAARLAAMTSPLGSSTRATSTRSQPTSPATSAPRFPTDGGFADLLAQQLDGLGGSPDAMNDPMTALLGLGQRPATGAGLHGLSGIAGLGGTGVSNPRSALSDTMVSPQLAKAIAAASSAAKKTSTTSTSKAQKALTWAKSMLGRQDWNNLCERFVEEAYGTKGVYGAAKDAARDLVTNRGKSGLSKAPVGALLYFAADETNNGQGHAGIYLGNRQMISARPGGVQIESVDTAYNSARYVGWGAPPTTFPGRRTTATTPSTGPGIPRR